MQIGYGDGFRKPVSGMLAHGLCVTNAVLFIWKQMTKHKNKTKNVHVGHYVYRVFII